MAVSSRSDQNWVMPRTRRSPSPVEIKVGDSDSSVSESDTEDTHSPPVIKPQSHQEPQRLHCQPTTLDIVVESEEGHIILKESYHIPCGPPVFSGSDVRHAPPTNTVAHHADRDHISRFHGDNGLDVATVVKAKHAPVTAISIPQTSSEVQMQSPTPTPSATGMAENETLSSSHMSPSVSSATPGTIRSRTITHEHPQSTKKCPSERDEASDCHQNYDGDCATSPEIEWFRMGACLRIPDRAAASDEYHRIKLQRIEQLRNKANKHRNPAYAKFKAEYRLRKQEERNEERRIRSLAKQNAEAAMFFQVLEVESDLERRRVSSGSRHKSRVYRLPSTV